MSNKPKIENGVDQQGQHNEQARNEVECYSPDDLHNICSAIVKPSFGSRYANNSTLRKVRAIDSDITQFTCKRCGHLVWMDNEVKEVILNIHTGKYYNKKYGLCRYCFISEEG